MTLGFVLALLVALPETFTVSIVPKGLPPLIVVASGSATIHVEASSDLERWAPALPPVDAAEVFTNGTLDVITPASWHFETNTLFPTNIVGFWNGQRMEYVTNTAPVVETTMIVDAWQTNLEPRIAWRTKPTNPPSNPPIPALFLRTRTH